MNRYATLKLKRPTYPSPTKGTVVVWSMIASLPVPGSTWHRLQYLVGLRRLGFDVWYVEDQNSTIFHPVDFHRSMDFKENLRYLREYMELIGFEDRWVYRPPYSGDNWLGALSGQGVRELYERADAIVNHTGAKVMRERPSGAACLVYLETDPVRNQIRVATGEKSLERELSQYDWLFTYGANIGDPTCKLPDDGFNWQGTRPAIISDWWRTPFSARLPRRLTTITSWKRGNKKDIELDHNTLRWSKCEGFLALGRLPRRAALPMELTIRGLNEQDRSTLQKYGWTIRNGGELSNLARYRNYIRHSAGECTAANHQNVATNSGWFSDRSASYLAAGRPVISEDTGFSLQLPTGQGLFAFRSEQEAESAIEAVAGDYVRHSSAASDIAHGYFDSEKVIGDTMRTIGLL